MTEPYSDQFSPTAMTSGSDEAPAAVGTSELTTSNFSFIAAVAMGYPLAWISKSQCRTLESRAFFNFFSTSLLIGLFLGMRFWVDLFLATAFTAFVASPSTSRWQMHPWAAVALLYLHLGIVQWRTFSIATAPMMMHVIRLVQFIWEMHDLRIKYAADESMYIRDRPFVENHAIYLVGYSFDSAGFFSGPTIEFSHWVQHAYKSLGNGMPIPEAISGSKQETSGDSHADPQEAGLQNRLLETFQKVCMCAVAFLATTQYDYLAFLASGAGFFSTMINLPLLAFHSRMKYYSVWLLAEGSFLVHGYPRAQYEMLNVWKVETATSMYEIVKNWNISTSKYLHKHVYLRLLELQRDLEGNGILDNAGTLVNPGSGSSGTSQTDSQTDSSDLRVPSLKKTRKRRATLCTFLLSAYWHGFHAGYYLSFASSALLTVTGRILRKSLRPYFVSDASLEMSPYRHLKAFYDLAGWIGTHYAIAYLMAPFVLFDLSSCLSFYWRTLFVVPLVCVGIVSYDKTARSEMLSSQAKVLNRLQDHTGDINARGVPHATRANQSFNTATSTSSAYDDLSFEIHGQDDRNNSDENSDNSQSDHNMDQDMDKNPPDDDEPFFSVASQLRHRTSGGTPVEME